MVSIPALLALAAFLAVAFVLAELGARARLAARKDYYVWAPHQRTLQVLDPESMPGLPPLVRFEVNRDGERGDEPPAEDTEAYRVLVLGGSSTECRYIDQPSSWPAVAQRLLSRPESLELLRAPTAHVGNVGRSLTSCGKLALILDRVLPRYAQLDAIVVMAGASDVVEWLSTGATDPAVEASFEPGELFDEHPEGPFGWGPSALALRRVLASASRSLLRRAEHHRGAGRGVGSARKARAKAEEILDTMPDPASLLERFDRSFRDLLGKAQAAARTVVVVRPCWARGGLGQEFPDGGWMFADGDLRTGRVERWYSQRVADRLLEMVERRMSAIAKELGAAEIDPKLLLESGPEHFYDVGHLSPTGCEILGNAVAQAVLRERQGRFGSRPRATAEERHADVA